MTKILKMVPNFEDVSGIEIFSPYYAYLFLKTLKKIFKNWKTYFKFSSPIPDVEKHLEKTNNNTDTSAWNQHNKNTANVRDSEFFRSTIFSRVLGRNYL